MYLGLEITAKRLNRPSPEFFTDEMYKRMGHFTLSTSTLSTDTVVFGGFGPVVDDGFGIGYNVSTKQLGAVICSNKVLAYLILFCVIMNGCVLERKECKKVL